MSFWQIRNLLAIRQHLAFRLVPRIHLSCPVHDPWLSSEAHVHQFSCNETRSKKTMCQEMPKEKTYAQPSSSMHDVGCDRMVSMILKFFSCEKISNHDVSWYPFGMALISSAIPSEASWIFLIWLGVLILVLASRALHSI